MIMHHRLRNHVFALAVAAALAGIAGHAQAAFLNPSLPGASEYEGWSDMTITRLGASYGTFPGASPWPNAIAPNESGSAGNAGFNKVSGNGFPSGSSLYAPFTSSVFEIENTDTFSLSDIETVVFQIDIGPGDGGNFFDAAPTLSYNGGTQSLAADYTATASGSYPFTNPVNPTETGTTTIFQYQWDLSGLGAVTDYEIQWTTHSHSQTYELQVDVGDTFARVIPEPGSAILMSAALLTLGSARVRRSRR